MQPTGGTGAEDGQRRRIEEVRGEKFASEEGAGSSGTSKKGSNQAGPAEEELADDEVLVPSRMDGAGPDQDWVEFGWHRFDYYTRTASDVSRRLSLVGFGAILFVTGLTSDDFAAGKSVDLPNVLVVGGALLAISLLLDLLQYVVGSLLWFAWPRMHEYLEDRPGYVAPIRIPGALPVPINVLLVLKLVSGIAGWVALLIYIANLVH